MSEEEDIETPKNYRADMIGKILWTEFKMIVPRNWKWLFFFTDEPFNLIVFMLLNLSSLGKFI